METDNESMMTESEFSSFTESNRDDDLPPKQKRAFVKMLAKFIRCAKSFINPITFFSFHECA